jgi:predicted aconitase with swiveling domain
MIQLAFLIGVLLAGPDTAELSGTVVDAHGQPIAGAIVVISTGKP